MEITQEELTNLLLLIQQLDKRVSKLEEQTSSTGVIVSGVPKFVKDFLDSKKEGDK